LFSPELDEMAEQGAIADNKRRGSQQRRPSVVRGDQPL
jgi:hypothetical protein